MSKLITRKAIVTINCMSDVTRHAKHIFRWSDANLKAAIASHLDAGSIHSVEARCCLYLRAYRKHLDERVYAYAPVKNY